MLRTADKRLFLNSGLRDALLRRSPPGYGQLGVAADRYVAEVLADAPLGFYKCDDESGLAQDSSGNGNHMTTNNIPTAKAYRLPGPMAGAYGIHMGGGSNFTRSVLTTATDNWALELIFKLVAVTSDDTILLNGTRSAAGYGIDLVVANSKFRALFGGVAFLDSSTAVVSTTVWKHIVVVRRAGTTEYYVNGAVDDSNAGTQTPNTPTTKSQIGSDGNVGGVWSMCAFYNTAISAARIAAHAQATGL